MQWLAASILYVSTYYYNGQRSIYALQKKSKNIFYFDIDQFSSNAQRYWLNITIGLKLHE